MEIDELQTSEKKEKGNNKNNDTRGSTRTREEDGKRDSKEGINDG